MIERLKSLLGNHPKVLSRIACETGIHHTSIVWWWRGVHHPSKENRAKLEAFLEKNFKGSNGSLKLPLPNLTKHDIMRQVSGTTGVTQFKTLEIIQETLDEITRYLAIGGCVELRNFGIFEIKRTPKRVGRNPNVPGSRVEIPPRTKVKFTAGKIMRQKVADLAQSLPDRERPLEQ